MGARASNFRIPMLLLGFAACAATGSLWAANLTVQVRERGNGQPIENAAVCLGTGANPTQFGAMRTDSAGKAVFDDILDTPLVLVVSKSEHRGERRNIEGIHYDSVLTVLLPRGGLGPRCEAPSAGGDEGNGLQISNFRIDGGARRTNNRQVSLEFSTAGGATDYRVSESQDFVDARWQPITAKRRYTLSAGAGPKHVYLQLRKYRNSEGLVLETRSNVVSDTIDLQP